MPSFAFPPRAPGPLVGAFLALAGLASIAAAQPASERARRLDPADRDTTCLPCRDFYRYANGGWLSRVSIPPAYPSYGSFRQVRDQNELALRDLLEAAARDPKRAENGDSRKLGAYYGTCMDSAAAEAAGTRPIEPELSRIAGLASSADLTTEVARLHLQGIPALFRFGAEQDAKNSSRVIAGVVQGGLGLPDRDYYTKVDSASRHVRSEYEAHVARTFVLLGTPPEEARADAARVMAIETALARGSMTNVERRDPQAVYHKMRVEELVALAPDFGWNVYLRRAGVDGIAALDVAQPDFFATLGGMLASVPLADWKSYLRWKVASDAAPLLAAAFVDEDFRFAQVLSGAQEPPPRWRRCLRATDEALGEALGREYVQEYFSPEAKGRALAMVGDLRAAMADRLAALEWMSDSTRAQALSKLEAMGEKIGYPDRWRDFSRLEIDSRSFVLARSRVREFEVRRRLAKIGRPVDRAEWAMTPPTVNAYYSSSMNQINFPAGILQPPFFDPETDDAVNYGGMGAVIGHEMIHGFDDRGRQFDAQGNLRDWWTSADQASFRARAQVVVDQYACYVAVDSLRLNGKLTLGENIADLGGLTVAFAALQRSMQGKPRPPLIGGLTPEQRFFLSWAQVWRELTRSEMARTLALTNPHSPGRWRVNGPLANLPEFARAFGCEPGDPMVRPDSLRAQIW